MSRKVPSKRDGWNRRLVTAGGVALALGGGYFAFRRPQSSSGFNFSKGDPRTLRRGNAAEPATLDSQKGVTQWEDWIVGDMMVGLMHQDAAGNPIPCACESMTASADGLTYTIKLRDHKWSDGMPVTADDYVFSFRRIADPKTAAQYVSILYPIKNVQAAAEGKVSPDQVGVRAIDARTLEIEVLYQTPYLDQLLMHTTTYAVPKHVVEKHGDDWVKPQNIVTNGPFILKEWIPNEHIHLVKNPLFYDAANVALDHVYFYPTDDSSAALKRFRAGELDLVNRCPPTSEVAVLRKTMARELRISPFIATYYLVVNQSRPPFDDIRVRQALSMAIDRETLLGKVLKVGQIPSYNLVPPGMPGYSYAAHARFRGEPLAARVQRAKALLAEAGFGPHNPLQFDFTIYNKLEFKLVSVALQAMWHDIGVAMRPLPVESQILFEMQRKHDFVVATTGWVADYRDPKNFLFLFQSTSTDLNYGLYNNPRYDRLVEQSDHIRDPQARLAAMAEAEQILLDEMGLIPLYHDVTRDTVSPQVKGWISNPSDFNRSRWLSLDRSIQTI